MNTQLYRDSDDGEVILDVEYEMYGEYSPAYICGPPELCREAEYPELDILEVTIQYPGEDPVPMNPSLLTEWEVEQIFQEGENYENL